jgi:RHS repeat-associated protein
MYDTNGEKTWEADLDIYGRVRTFAGRSLSECPFRYQGQYQDEETGLYYNRFRYYDAEVGNYLSQDPIRVRGGFVLYGYVKNVNFFVDALGLVETMHFPDFDSAREAAFKIASGGNADVTFTPTKIDPVTGTEVEFKGSNGSKIAYDSTHADMDPKLGHDKPHVGVQTGGKRGQGGSKRMNLTYDGETHPHRSNVKGLGDH